MNSTTSILIGEFFLVLVFLVIGIGVYAWRKKRRLLAALDILLSNVAEAEPERKKTLIGRLKKTYPIDEAKAQELGNEIFRSERLFLKKLIQLLLDSKIDEITRFNEEIYALSGPYWDLLPFDLGAVDPQKSRIKNSADIPGKTSARESDDQPNDDHVPEISMFNTVEEDSKAETTSTGFMPDIEIENAGVVGSNEAADQSIPGQDQSEPDPSENINDSMPASLDEENAKEPSLDDAFDQVAQGSEASEIKIVAEVGDNGGDEARKISEPEASS